MSTHFLVDDLVKVTFRALANRQSGQVSCHFRVLAVGGLSITPQGAADAWQLLADAAWPGVLAPSAFGANVLVERIVVAGGRVTEYGQGSSTFPPGTVGTGHVPTQVAPIIKKYTGVAGPKHRGRMFMPFLPNDFMNDEGELIPTGSTAYRSWQVALMPLSSLTLGTAPDTATFQPVLFHRHPTASTFEDVESFPISPKLGTQKRRGDYGTPNHVL